MNYIVKEPFMGLPPRTMMIPTVNNSRIGGIVGQVLYAPSVPSLQAHQTAFFLREIKSRPGIFKEAGGHDWMIYSICNTYNRPWFTPDILVMQDGKFRSKKSSISDGNWEGLGYKIHCVIRLSDERRFKIRDRVVSPPGSSDIRSIRDFIINPNIPGGLGVMVERRMSGKDYVVPFSYVQHIDLITLGHPEVFDHEKIDRQAERIKGAVIKIAVLKKDITNPRYSIPAGSVFRERSGYYTCGHSEWYALEAELVENSPDWFNVITIE